MRGIGFWWKMALSKGNYDDRYQQAGATLVTGPKTVFLRLTSSYVRSPQPSEYALIKPGQILFTYFHCAASEPLTQAMIMSKAVCIAYETITDTHGPCPCLRP